MRCTLLERIVKPLPAIVALLTRGLGLIAPTRASMAGLLGGPYPRSRSSRRFRWQGMQQQREKRRVERRACCSSGFGVRSGRERRAADACARVLGPERLNGLGESLGSHGLSSVAGFKGVREIYARGRWKRPPSA